MTALLEQSEMAHRLRSTPRRCHSPNADTIHANDVGAIAAMSALARAFPIAETGGILPISLYEHVLTAGTTYPTMLLLLIDIQKTITET